MQILNRTNVMGIPADYVYPNTYGTGAQPAPLNFGQIQQGIQNPSQQFTTNQPTELPSPDQLNHQFQYQNDPAYQHGIAPSQSYYPAYAPTQYGGYYMNSNPLARHEEGYYNPYLSKPIMDQNPNPEPEHVYGYTYAAEQQKRMQEQQTNQMSMHNKLCTINNRYYGIEHTEVDEQKILEEQEKRYNIQIENQNAVNLYCYIDGISNTMQQRQEQYISPERQRYIDEWNRKYDAWTGKFPEKYGVYEFFNDSIAENMYMETIKDQAKRSERNLNQLYNSQQFRNDASKTWKNYDPLTNTSYGDEAAKQLMTRRSFALDDMEIALPESLKHEDEERRNRFINAILGGVK